MSEPQWDILTAMLDEPLDPARVKQRKQGGKPISYLEGYDAIKAANQIFGYGGWSYRVNDVTFVRMHDVGFYQAIVTVRVGDVERTDVGCCDVAVSRDKGIDAASADAFQTALKGAATDGLKRALRTFGSQFGNDLYDTDDPNRADHEQHPQGARQAQPPAHAQVHAQADQPCPTCGGGMTLRSGTTRDGRPYTAWFCDAKCGQKPLWLNERTDRAS